MLRKKKDVLLQRMGHLNAEEKSSFRGTIGDPIKSSLPINLVQARRVREIRIIQEENEKSRNINKNTI